MIKTIFQRLANSAKPKMKLARLSMVAGLTALLTHSVTGWAEDIDVFASGLTEEAMAETRPTILIVFDNTSNWSKNSQQFPEAVVAFEGSNYDAKVMGEFELAAVQSALSAVANEGDFNVGVMSFTTQGSNQDGGFVRFDSRHYQGEMLVSGANVPVQSQLETILKNSFIKVQDPVEKINANENFGNLAQDVYSYLAGANQSFMGVGTPASLADTEGYHPDHRVDFARFESPLDENAICADTYLIWVGNPNPQGPRGDDADNSSVLAALYSGVGATPPQLADGLGGSTPIMMPEYPTLTGNSGATEEFVDYSQACFTDVNACTAAVDTGGPVDNALGADIVAACSGISGCYCSNSGPSSSTTAGPCPKQDKKPTKSYQVFAPVTQVSGSYERTGRKISGEDYNFDDWTRFMYDYGVPMSYTDDDGEKVDMRSRVTTFTIDVYNKSPSPEFSALLDSAATVGGGYRIAANNYSALVDAFSQIFTDILAVNSSFAAVTLPLSASKRTEAQNKVFIASFTPDGNRRPRWLGNLKQYKLGFRNNVLDLVDVNGAPAVNPLTGIVDVCAQSQWTTDSGEYFDGLQVLDPEVGSCATAEGAFNSDAPDGPHVAKGGAAQQIRQQSARKLYVLADGDSKSTLTAGDNLVLQYMEGTIPGLVGGDRWTSAGTSRVAVGSYFMAPAALEALPMPDTGRRPTIHGDVIHSQPLTITYDANTIRLFYGANDGFYRMLNPDDGTEAWAFVASEHLGKLDRLYENSPTVKFSESGSAIPDDLYETPRDYFMDGPTGSYIEYSGSAVSKAWIYPTMRRGGNVIYALDVSPDGNGNPPSEPKPKWKYELSGQAWGMPFVGKVNGYANPVVIVGGGYDSCLDVSSSESPIYSSACGSDPDGTQLVVLDAFSGEEVVVPFEVNASSLSGCNETSCGNGAPIVADVVGVDLQDAEPPVYDLVYATDAKGGVYRLNFNKFSGDAMTPATGSGDWTIDRIAQVDAAGNTKLRFFNRPALADVNYLGNQHVFVLMGAGDREHPLKAHYPYADSDSGVDYHFYAVIDRLYAWDVDGDGTASAPHGRDPIDLDDQCDSGDSVPCAGLWQVGDGDELPANIFNYQGWRYTLTDRGEQVINRAVVDVGTVFFNSYQPEGPASICQSFGTAKGYRIPIFQPDQVSDVQFNVPTLPPPPSIETVEICEGTTCVTKTVCFYCGDTDGDGVATGPVEEVPLDLADSLRQAHQVRKGPDN